MKCEGSYSSLQTVNFGVSYCELEHVLPYLVNPRDIICRISLVHLLRSTAIWRQCNSVCSRAWLVLGTINTLLIRTTKTITRRKGRYTRSVRRRAQTLDQLFWGNTIRAAGGSFNDLLTHSMEQSPSWEVNRFAASQEIPPHFIEPNGSLPQSQVPATCPCPEPARSSL